MGVFIGLNLCDSSKQSIKKLQEGINLPFSVKQEDLHCTLFTSKDDFDYEPEDLNYPIEIKDIKIGKIKTQKGVDCLALFFDSEFLKDKYENFKKEYNVKPYYKDFKLHITLSYDCGDIDEGAINLNDYIKELKIINEYVQPLRFEVDRRSSPRD